MHTIDPNAKPLILPIVLHAVIRRSPILAVLMYSHRTGLHLFLPARHLMRPTQVLAVMSHLLHDHIHIWIIMTLSWLRPQLDFRPLHVVSTDLHQLGFQ